MADSTNLRLPSLQRLQSAEQMELLDIVDSLRACGLNEIVALPQLIVCGDQSSGKSSVLEAISGIPFPRGSGLCTRFATEVILRRASRDEISVSIVPGRDRTQIDCDRLKDFHPELKTTDDFSGLFDNARDAMGLSSTGKSLSNDVLRVEFCGPSQPQLTLVDIPGLIHAEIGDQTAGNVEFVHNLVSRYLKSPRSIILAVVAANNDISNQIILQKARQVDPQGLRTLGIITKPDLLASGSEDEEAFMALARNDEVKLSLGWHVVMNLDSKASKDRRAARDAEETLFFQQSSFKHLPTHHVGISFLRTRLSKVLFDQIRTELPRLVEDIESQISTSKSVQQKLGPSRAEFDDQRSFLISLSQSFQTICRDAMRGDYEHDFFQVDQSPERRLCANVMNMHFKFAKEMRKNGAAWLVDDGSIGNNRHRTRKEAIKEACILLKKSRGRELPGLPNPLLVGELFRQYSRPWGNIARLHIRSVWEATNLFFELLLRHLTDDAVCENILLFWLNPIMEEKLKSAHDKLDELLEVHKDYPMTTNSLFINNSRRPRPNNSKEQLEDAMNKAFLFPGQKMGIDEINRLLSNFSPKADLDMDMVAAEEAFDNMNAYYEVALNLFTDNVPTLAIQLPIIREVPKILCPTTVFSMTPDVIKRIAGETDEKVLEREATERRLTVLEKGAQICKVYALRPQTFVPTIPEDNISELPDAMRQPSNTADKSATDEPGTTGSNFSQSLPVRGAFGDSDSSLASSQTADPSSKPFTLSAGSTYTTSLFHNLETESKKSKKVKPDRTKPGSSTAAEYQGLFRDLGKSGNVTSIFGPTSSTSQSLWSSPFGQSSSTVKVIPPAVDSTSSGIFGQNSSPAKVDLSAVGPTSGGAFGSGFIGSTVESTAVKTFSSISPSSETWGPSSTAASDSKPGFPDGRSSPSIGTINASSGIKFPKSNPALMVPSKTTLGIKFDPYIEREAWPATNQMNAFQSISFMPECRNFSCEEMRLTDYRARLNK